MLLDCLTLLPSGVEIIKFSTEEPFQTFLFVNVSERQRLVMLSYSALHSSDPISTSHFYDYFILNLRVIYFILQLYKK
jgi:hypothetical protein